MRRNGWLLTVSCSIGMFCGAGCGSQAQVYLVNGANSATTALMTGLANEVLDRLFPKADPPPEPS